MDTEDNTADLLAADVRLPRSPIPWGQVSNTWTERQARQLLSQLGSVLYAVRTDGLIKIGYTTDLYSRISHIGGVGGTELLAFRFGDTNDEAVVHQALSPYAAHGREYYHPTPEVLALVNEWRHDLGLATDQ